jgi:hypothetical protein
VRRYVQRRKEELGLAARETFVPQSYDWGSEGQADWYEAAADFDNGRQTTHFFTMRSMAGGGRFTRLIFTRLTTERKADPRLPALWAAPPYPFQPGPNLIWFTFCCNPCGKIVNSPSTAPNTRKRQATN